MEYEATYSSVSTFAFDEQAGDYTKEYFTENPPTLAQLHSLQYNPLALSPQTHAFDNRPVFVSQQYYPTANTNHPFLPTNRLMPPGLVDYPDYDPLVSPGAFSGMTNSIVSISPDTPSEPLYASGCPDLNFWSPNLALQSNLSAAQTVDHTPEKSIKRGGSRALICPTCHKRHTRKNRMEDCNSRDKHQKRHPCNGRCGNSTCTMVYVSADGLRRHRWPEEHRKITCPYCFKPSSRQNIARHKNTCSRRPTQAN